MDQPDGTAMPKLRLLTFLTRPHRSLIDRVFNPVPNIKPNPLSDIQSGNKGILVGFLLALEERAVATRGVPPQLHHHLLAWHVYCSIFNLFSFIYTDLFYSVIG